MARLLRVVVSRHARRRWYERGLHKLGLRDIHGVARSAWNRGQDAAVLKKPTRRRKRPGIEKLYLGYVFVFQQVLTQDTEEVTLITIIKPRPR